MTTATNRAAADRRTKTKPKQQRADNWITVNRVRLGHVRRLLCHRYGVELPDDDAGSEDLRILLHIKARCYAPARREQALLNEIGLMAPWMAAERAKQIAAEIAAKPMRLKADTLGRLLNVTTAERDRLGIWQIGAVDLDAVTRKERRRQRDRERKARQRHVEGRVSRDQYRATALSNTQPWLALGICRRTWERRRAKGTLSQVCPQSTLRSGNGHTCDNPHPEVPPAMVPAAPDAAAALPHHHPGGSDRQSRHVTPAAPHGGTPTESNLMAITRQRDSERSALGTDPSGRSNPVGRSWKAEAFRLAGETWGPSGRALVGKALSHGLDASEVIDIAIHECGVGGDAVEDVDVFAHCLWMRAKW